MTDNQPENSFDVVVIEHRIKVVVYPKCLLENNKPLNRPGNLTNLCWLELNPFSNTPKNICQKLTHNNNCIILSPHNPLQPDLVQAMINSLISESRKYHLIPIALFSLVRTKYKETFQFEKYFHFS